jgi:adenylate kinase family enzyme
VERINVVGASGSGKSTVASRLSEMLDIPHVELDALQHQPGWAQLPVEELREQVTELTSGPRWIVDGNYSSILGDLVWSRADTLVWLDLPRAAVMRQLVPRTVTRAVTRRELWNGNREPITGLIRWDPHHSILRWSWTRHPMVRERYTTMMEDPAYGHLRFVRLRTRAEVRGWLSEVATARR